MIVKVLKDTITDRIVSLFLINEIDESGSLQGVLFSVDSYVDNVPCDLSYIATVWVKFDGTLLTELKGNSYVSGAKSTIDPAYQFGDMFAAMGFMRSLYLARYCVSFYNQNFSPKEGQPNFLFDNNIVEDFDISANNYMNFFLSEYSNERIGE